MWSYLTFTLAGRHPSVFRFAHFHGHYYCRYILTLTLIFYSLSSSLSYHYSHVSALSVIVLVSRRMMKKSSIDISFHDYRAIVLEGGKCGEVFVFCRVELSVVSIDYLASDSELVTRKPSTLQY